MKVWVVITGNGPYESGYHDPDVFDSKLKADEYVNNMTYLSALLTEVHEVEVK